MTMHGDVGLSERKYTLEIMRMRSSAGKAMKDS